MGYSWFLLFSMVVGTVLASSLLMTWFWWSLIVVGFVAFIIVWTPLRALDDGWKERKAQRNLLNKRWKYPVDKDEFDVVIVGTGPSALHCAAVLASAGRSVCCLEQHDVVGGASHQYVLNAEGCSYTFDSGLHYAIPMCEQMTQVCLGTAVAPVRWPKLGVNGQGTYELIVYDDNEPPFEIKHKEAHLEALRAVVGTSAPLDNAAHAMKGWPLYLVSRVFAYPMQGWIRSLCGQFKSFGGITHSEALKDVRDPKARALLQGLWLNTGSRPSKVSNLLAASVLRGFPQVGGAYPMGGAQATAKAIVSFLKQQDCEVYVKARVAEFVLHKGRCVGCLMEDGSMVRAKQGVVSSVGYLNSRKLIPQDFQHGWPESFPGIAPSDGFVSVQIGMRPAFSFSNPSKSRQNLWYSAVDPDWAVEQGLESFLSGATQLPFGILWG